MFTLSLGFFLIALIYSTVGFGGGTSYIALLGLSGIPFTSIPKISLLCNILVVSSGCWQYLKKGHFKKNLAIPFVISSVPMAFLGGRFPISEKTFYFLLVVSLFFSGARLLLLKVKEAHEIRTPSFQISIFVGALLGLLSGMVGIGGGIFLSPLLINMGWARSKDAAAVASLFILLNSLAGLGGQIYKDVNFHDPLIYLPLFVAVFIGGQLGSRIGTNSRISAMIIQKSTGILTLFISFRILIKTL